MVSVVTERERSVYRGALANMHRDRKRIFIDRLGWDIPTVDGQFEIDQFDTADAVYLVVHDRATDRHLGSMRLLPSTRPHIMSEIFPHLCEEGVPIGEDVWEVSRFCTAPELKDPLPVRTQLLMGLVEYALLLGVRRFTCVTHLSFLSQLLAIGWDCEPLGLPVQDKGGMIGALAISITPATLTLLRNLTGLHAPVLVLPTQVAA